MEIMTDLENEACEHRKTKDALMRRENLLREILNILPVGVWITDEDGEIVCCNSMSFEIWGSARALFDGPDRPGKFKGRWTPTGETVELEECEIARILQKGALSFEEEREIELSDGTIKTVLYWSSPILKNNGKIDMVVHVVQDVSERKRAENENKALHEMLIQAQKIESIGMMAGGVAHDFKNMLSIILGYAQMVLDMLDPADRISEKIRQIILAGNMSRDVIHQLLSFARQQPLSTEILNMNDIVTNFIMILHPLMEVNINLEWELTVGLWPVRMPPTQVEQILVNLTVNARDAIGRNKGRIAIKTDNAVFDETSCETFSGIKPGEYVLLAVRDNGCGMDNETRASIFEPFYSTKREGKGTGLGLTSVYSIVRQAGGFIYVDSEPGECTTFKIYIPRFNPGDLKGEKKNLPK